MSNNTAPVTSIIREVPWANLGTQISRTVTSMSDVLSDANLDWEVSSKKAYYYNSVLKKNEPIPNLMVNVRYTDQAVLGKVTNKYQVIQNSVAFGFIDKLLENHTAEVVKAGELNGGSQTWVVLKLDDYSILGDDITPYLIVTNSFDGSESVKVVVTPVRVVCKNAMSIALRHARRAYYIRHIGDLENKIEIMDQVMDMTHGYIDSLSETAEKFSKIKVSDDDFNKVLDLLYKVDLENMTQRRITNLKYSRDQIVRAYNEPDLLNIKGTAWGVLQAVADVSTHYQYQRNISNLSEKTMAYIINGSAMTDKVYEYFMSK